MSLSEGPTRAMTTSIISTPPKHPHPHKRERAHQNYYIVHQTHSSPLVSLPAFTGLKLARLWDKRYSSTTHTGKRTSQHYRSAGLSCVSAGLSCVVAETMLNLDAPRPIVTPAGVLSGNHITMISDSTNLLFFLLFAALCATADCVHSCRKHATLAITRPRPDLG